MDDHDQWAVETVQCHWGYRQKNREGHWWNDLVRDHHQWYSMMIHLDSIRRSNHIRYLQIYPMGYYPFVWYTQSDHHWFDHISFLVIVVDVMRTVSVDWEPKCDHLFRVEDGTAMAAVIGYWWYCQMGNAWDQRFRIGMCLKYEFDPEMYSVSG